MMTCRELVETLIDFVADQSPPEHQQRVEQHLRLCTSCVAYVDSYRCTVQLGRQLPRSPLPAQLQRRLENILQASAQEAGPQPGDAIQ